MRAELERPGLWWSAAAAAGAGAGRRRSGCRPRTACQPPAAGAGQRLSPTRHPAHPACAPAGKGAIRGSMRVLTTTDQSTFQPYYADLPDEALQDIQLLMTALQKDL